MNRKRVRIAILITSISLIAIFLYTVFSSVIGNIKHLKASGSSKLSNQINKSDSTIFSDELLGAVTIPFGSTSKIGRYNLYWLNGGNQLVVTSKGLPNHLNFMDSLKLVATEKQYYGEAHYTTDFLGGNFYLNPANISDSYKFCYYKAGSNIQEISRSQDTLILKGNPGFLSLSNDKGDDPLGFIFNKSINVEIAMFNSNEGVLVVMLLSKSKSGSTEINGLFRK